MCNEPSEIERAIILDEENPILRIDPQVQELPIESDLDEYIYGCSQGLSAISTAIEKVKIAIIMLEQARDLIPKDSPFNESEHIEYAIENYFIRSASLYDRCLIFTNKLLNLGIANESIEHVPLVTNEHVKNNGLSEPLKNIRRACREFSQDRNVIIHHGRYNDESFKTVSAVHKANQLSVENGWEPPFKEEVIDALTDKAINEKLIDFNEHLNKIEAKINDFYTIALPIYHKFKGKLK